MKENKMEEWRKDAKFMRFAERRMSQELMGNGENRRYDSLFEKLDEAFDNDDRYVEPLVEYLTCRLHMAKLDGDKRRRERGIWWVWYHVTMEGCYVQVFSRCFDPLLEELRTELMSLLHEEYMNLVQINQ